MRCLFKSHNLIGDALYVGPALRQWIKDKGVDYTDTIYMQTLPDHIKPLYQGMIRDLQQQLGFTFVTVSERPEGEFKFEHVFDVSAAFGISDKKQCHVADSYAELLGVKLEGDNERLKPIYIPEPTQCDDRDLKDCILISAFSASCTSRDKNRPNLPPNKMLPWEKWKPMLALLRKEFPDNKIRFLGAPTDFIPNGYAQDIVQAGEYMTGIPLNRLALIMKYAKLLVTIDNGMSHLGASQDTPTYLMYPRCLGPHYILPIGNPNLLTWVHIDPVHVAANQLKHTLGYAIQKLKSKENV